MQGDKLKHDVLEHFTFFVAETAKAFDLSLPKFLANSATERPRDFENCCRYSNPALHAANEHALKL